MHDSPGPLVLLPGMNCSARLFAPVLQALGEAAGPAARVEELAEDSIDGCVDVLLDTLPERFALAGLSLGGIVAMALVRRAPQRVTRLCLMSTNARGPTSSQLTAWTRQRQELAAGRTARDLQRDLLPLLLHESNRTPLLDEKVLAMADDTGEQILDSQLRAQATRVDERDRLPEVRVPCLVVAAAQDALCPVARHEEIRSLVPGSTLVVLDDVGHLSTLEAPDRVAAGLGRWLSRDRG